MVALQIRDVPEEVRATLMAQAASRGQSLQAYLLDLVRRHAAQAGNARLLESFGGRSDGIHAEAGEVAAVVSADRARREQDLSG
jgi:plasmid stability protein